MKKQIFLALFLLVLFFSVANAAEYPLTNNGFETITLNSINSKDCQTLNIPKIDSKTENGILSINAEFLGKAGDNSYVSVKINDGQEQILWPELFDCQTSCWARVFFSDLTKKDSEVEICLVTGGTTTKATIFDSSKIGLYSTPSLEIENISPQKITLGERVKMIIKVTNTANQPADVFIQFITQDLRTFLKVTSFDIVEGDTSVTTIINPNETREFIYYIKPTQVSAYNLPSAALFFENIFGEKQKIFSGHPQLEVMTPDQISMVLVGTGLKDNKFNFKLILKNNWDGPFTGLLEITPKDLTEQFNSEIILAPLQEKEITYSTAMLNPGDFSLLAQITDKDKNEVVYLSDSMSFQVNTKDYSFELVFSFIAVVVALVAFAWIYYQKA